MIFGTELKSKLSSPPFISDRRIFLAAADGETLILSAEDGATVGKITNLMLAASAIYLNGGTTLYYGDLAGSVSAMNILRHKTKWKTWTGGAVTALTPAPKGLLVVSNDNYVYLLSEKSGKRVWKKRLEGRVADGAPLIVGGGTAAAFAIYGTPRAVFVDLTKGKQINQVSLSEADYFVGKPMAAANGLLVFPTFQGLVAFGTAGNCATAGKHRSVP